jgi:uncharacterized membrane protein
MTMAGDPLDPVPTDLTRRSGGAARLRNYFLTGLVIAAPVGITAWIIWTFVSWVDSRIKPLIPARYSPETYLSFPLPGFGLVVALVALTLLGFLTANLVGRRMVNAGERLLERMPIVRPLYRGLKQVFETLFSQSGSTFRKVAMVEFPSPGMWSLVFLSSTPGSQVTSRLPGGDDYVSAFLPCTPNPTTGFFFYVPKSAVIELDITVESAAKLIMSAGLIQPDAATESPQARMAALAATARQAQLARQQKAAE